MLNTLPTGEVIGKSTNMTDDFDNRASLEAPALGKVNAYDSISDVPSPNLFPPIDPDKTIAVLHKDTGKVVIYYPQGSNWVELSNKEPEPVVKSTGIFFKKEMALYCSNAWGARNFGSIGDGISTPDAAAHYRINRDMVLDLDAAVATSEGSGMTIGVAWQIYRSGNWLNPSNLGNSRVWAGGAGYLNDRETIQFKAGEWLRLLTLASDGGGNSYPGNRAFRIFIEERVAP